MRVLVTGACGGLGSRVTSLLAARGDTVIAADIDRRALARLRETARRGTVAASSRRGISADSLRRGISADSLRRGIPADSLRRVISLRMNVTSEKDVDLARARIERVAGGLDAIVCCAGVFTAGPLVGADADGMRKAFEVNLMGAFRVVRTLFPLLARPGGRVVLVSSETTRCAMPLTGPYTISKRALEAYAEVLRRELMFLGVSVSVIQPGAFRTRLLERSSEQFDEPSAVRLFPAQVALVRDMVKKEWDRGMDPSRVAAAVAAAVHARRPRRRVRIGNDPLRALLGALPAAWADQLIRRFARA
jgi:NAD(P)-dependent dehydrogenase (short-subunit alcohol dehydrogenase family)